MIEAEDKRAMSRSTQGLAIRMAKALNRVMNRRGSVFADRFHAHILHTASETRRALAYILRNPAIHAERRGDPASTGRDPYTSIGFAAAHLPLATECIVLAQTWLLRRAVASDCNYSAG